MSSPARMCISVDLPEPDGPITAVSWPAAHVERDALERVDCGVARAVAARDARCRRRPAARLRSCPPSGLNNTGQRAEAEQAAEGREAGEDAERLDHADGGRGLAVDEADGDDREEEAGRQGRAEAPRVTAEVEPRRRGRAAHGRGETRREPVERLGPERGEVGDDVVAAGRARRPARGRPPARSPRLRQG